MDTTTITTEVVELLCRISRQKLREQDITPLVVFLTALISIMRGVRFVTGRSQLKKKNGCKRLSKPLPAATASG